MGYMFVKINFRGKQALVPDGKGDENQPGFPTQPPAETNRRVGGSCFLGCPWGQHEPTHTGLFGCEMVPSFPHSVGLKWAPKGNRPFVRVPKKTEENNKRRNNKTKQTNQQTKTTQTQKNTHTKKKKKKKKKNETYKTKETAKQKKKKAEKKKKRKHTHTLVQPNIPYPIEVMLADKEPRPDVFKLLEAWVSWVSWVSGHRSGSILVVSVGLPQN